MAAAPTRPEELLGFGWEIAAATLASAESERKLVTHWLLTPGDADVNADDHFGSDERTLRFLGVVLPTLIDQLAAVAAVVAVPWGLDGSAPSLTVVGVGFGAPACVESRWLRRADAAGPVGARSPEGAGPPFWRLEPDPVAPPPELAAVAAGLAA